MYQVVLHFFFKSLQIIDGFVLSLPEHLGHPWFYGGIPVARPLCLGPNVDVPPIFLQELHDECH